MNPIRILSALAAVTVLITACAGPQAQPTAAPTLPPPTVPAPAESPPAAASPTAEATAAPPTEQAGTPVMAAVSPAYGLILVDGKGMSLYLFTKDSPGMSDCYGQCAANWPPLLTTGSPVAGQGVDAAKLGTTPRTDGTIQVTYNGWPLYTYARDTQPGDTAGQDVGGVWFLLSPEGGRAQQQTAPTSSSNYSY